MVMKAIQLDVLAQDPVKAIQNLKIVELPIPKPGPGEVLIKVGATTCNPSDLSYLVGVYGVKLTLPTIPGFEGWKDLLLAYIQKQSDGKVILKP